jgi:hypothetical protein
VLTVVRVDFPASCWTVHEGSAGRHKAVSSDQLEDRADLIGNLPKCVLNKLKERKRICKVE